MRFIFGRHVEFRSPHVLTIGNFDGVHVGHQLVIEQAKAVARLRLPLTVLLFEPQPREFFARQKGQSFSQINEPENKSGRSEIIGR